MNLKKEREREEQKREILMKYIFIIQTRLELVRTLGEFRFIYIYIYLHTHIYIYIYRTSVCAKNMGMLHNQKP
jgi:hypothetical protein